MKERGIMFKDWGVRAIRNMTPDVWPPEPIDSSKPIKWQTRRVVKPQPPEEATDVFTWFAGERKPGFSYAPEGCWIDMPPTEEDWPDDEPIPPKRGFFKACPYGVPGDGLWLRETWRHFEHDAVSGSSHIHYRADGSGTIVPAPKNWASRSGLQWRPSIHMPRWASREDLLVKEIRVERVQDITPKDVLAEGITKRQRSAAFPWHVYAQEDFASVWDSINVKRGFGWQVNPWVWVVTFMRKSKP